MADDKDKNGADKGAPDDDDSADGGLTIADVRAIVQEAIGKNGAAPAARGRGTAAQDAASVAEAVRAEVARIAEDEKRKDSENALQAKVRELEETVKKGAAQVVDKAPDTLRPISRRWWGDRT